MRTFSSLSPLLLTVSLCVHCGDDERSAGAGSASGGAVGSGGAAAGGMSTGGGGGATLADAGDASSGGMSAGGGPGAGGTAAGGAASGGLPGGGGAPGSGGDDGGPPPAPDECDPATQTGCDPAERCVLRGDIDRTRCEPGGAVPIGGACSAAADAGAGGCVPEALCAGETCLGICTSSGACGGGTNCVPVADLRGAGVCIAGCDPFTGAGCQAPEGCYASPGGPATFCAREGSGSTGIRCSDFTACPAQHGCVAAAGETATRCRSHCDVSSPDSGACAGRCVAYLDVYGVAGPDRLGFCVPD